MKLRKTLTRTLGCKMPMNLRAINVETKREWEVFSLKRYACNGANETRKGNRENNE